MLSSAEHEKSLKPRGLIICPANKWQFTHNCKLSLAKHSWAWKFLAQMTLQQDVIRAFYWKIGRKLAFRSGHTSTIQYLVFSSLHNKSATIPKHFCQICMHSYDVFTGYMLSNRLGSRKWLTLPREEIWRGYQGRLRRFGKAGVNSFEVFNMTHFNCLWTGTRYKWRYPENASLLIVSPNPCNKVKVNNTCMSSHVRETIFLAQKIIWNVRA